MTTRARATIVALVIGLVAVVAVRRGSRRPRASGSVSVLSDTFPMASLHRTRRVRIYLPPDYATSQRRYPVLYVQDGQTALGRSSDVNGGWRVDEALDSLHRAGDPGAIVVAIDNGGLRRMDEYDPWRDPIRNYGGEGGAYVAFLTEELKPYVDRHYRTLADRAHTGIIGSSAGALIALYASLVRGDVFGRVALFSCSALIGAPQIYDLTRHTPPHADARFYLVSGEYETPSGRPAKDQRVVVDALTAAGYAPGASIRSVFRADGKHAEWFWRREFPAAYLWLFTDPRR